MNQALRGITDYLRHKFCFTSCRLRVELAMTSYDRNTADSIPGAPSEPKVNSAFFLWCVALGLLLLFVVVTMTVSGPPDLAVGAVPP